ncbi:MAG: hypothetical protein ABL921_04140 [Pirellula sp.]
MLNEFRAQKKRADELESRNVQLENRLAESEKQLALSGNGYANRKMNSRSDSELLIGEASGTGRDLTNLSSTGSSRSAGSRAPSLRTGPGLPDANPPTPGKLASGSNRDPISLGGPPRDLRGDRNRDSQWRPISGAQP